MDRSSDMCWFKYGDVICSFEDMLNRTKKISSATRVVLREWKIKGEKNYRVMMWWHKLWNYEWGSYNIWFGDTVRIFVPTDEYDSPTMKTMNLVETIKELNTLFS